MSRRVRIFLVSACLAFLLLPARGNAACAGTETLIPVVPDGRFAGATVTAGNTVGLTFSLRGPRSFSGEIRAQFMGPGLTVTLNNSGTTGTCTDNVGAVSTTQTEPIAPNIGRGSWTQPSTTLTSYVAEVQNTTVSPIVINASVVETTLYNSAWSTFGTTAT